VSAGLAAIGMTVGPSASYWWRSGYLAPLTLLGSFSILVIALAARQLLGLQGGLIRQPGGPLISQGVRLYAVFGYNLLLISAVLAIRVLSAQARRRRGP
jgi:hypothetical protein